MTIEHGAGDLLQANVDALVNPVNVVGVMGKGLALQFKKAFPDVLKAYKRACDSGELVIGRVHVVHRETPPQFIIHFPTKEHWKNPSKIEFIRSGLIDLVEQVREREIKSIAIPPLGCGLGGLNWSEVETLIVNAFASLPDVRVVLFEP